MKLFYTPLQSVAANASYSPSAGKPAAFVEAALGRFPGRVEVDRNFRGVSAKGLALAHHPDRVARVLALEEDNGFGNRLPEVAASLPWTTGSMWAAARHAATAGGAACSPTSGFHHASYTSGGGFCTFNGLVVAAILLRAEGLARRVGIIDFDAHWGNGTEDIIHRKGLGWIVNHSFGAFSGLIASPRAAETWLAGLEEELDQAAGNCDLLLYQAGADPHVDDPLGGYLTGDQLRRRDRAVFRWAAARGKPLAWNLAGGYQIPLSKVLDLHLATVEECLDAFEGGDRSRPRD
ncbi:MAG: hypothetical protein JNG85_11885 [Spirochaetaceae bacterium]|nr:hypothetical protein [Spirochaetaceae bacterium]